MNKKSWKKDRRKVACATLLSFFLSFVCYGQQDSFGINVKKTDSLYILGYPEKLKVMSFVSTRSLEIDAGDKNYSPNYPLNLGVGLVVKNTIFGMQLGYGFIPLKSKKEYGNSKVMDFQAHHYGRNVIVDLFFQNYKGFYSHRRSGSIEELFPDMSVLQFGAEATYLFNGKRYSSKAAFDLNELQLRSAGSWLVGGGAYYYRLKGFDDYAASSANSFENVQLGINAGYAYSLVLNDRWLLSGMAKAGVNFGDATHKTRNGKVDIYPTAAARFSGNYHKKDWGLSMVIMISNKSVYPIKSDELSLTSITMQLSYVKHLDDLFKKKNK
ncbi:DUF4421 family protein [Flavobacterium ginsenosidimutans]|uniref:DUF4421 family protein n=1 Tax=Flavobacterium ginsenosidimutans TaxID=687844 RepID=A0ABZ2Q5B6_9FLAO